MAQGPELSMHPMRFVIKHTGLSADLLRAWEKRYAAVAPARSSGGQRLYSDDDLDRLLLLRQVTDNGRNISQVAQLSADQLRALLLDDGGTRPLADRGESAPGSSTDLLPALLLATERLDAPELERLLRRSTLQFGATAAIQRVIVPFLHEIGTRWHRNELNPAHEHLASAVVQRTLHWVLEGTSPASDAPVVVVASLPGERHELGLQIVAAVAAGEAWRVIFLGTDLPLETVASAAAQSSARVVALSMVANSEAATVLSHLKRLRKLVGAGTAIIVGGAASVPLRPRLVEAGCHVLPDLDQLRAFLQTFRPIGA